MFILNQLSKLNIKLDELDFISENELIRIEKKLKATVVLSNNELSMNEVIRFVDILKNQREAINYIFHPDNKWIYSILSHPNEPVYDEYVIDSIEIIPNRKLTTFLDNHFYNELETYVSQCIKLKHYRGLYFLLRNQQNLPSRIVIKAEKELLKKLNYGTELIFLDTFKLQEKVSYLYNPYFFRCLNSVSKFQVEEDISDLLDAIVMQLNKGYYRSFIRILYGMGLYNSLDTNTNELYKNNKAIAEKEGAIEIESIDECPEGGSKLVYTYSGFNAKESEIIELKKTKKNTLHLENLWRQLVIIIFAALIFPFINYITSKPKKISSSYLPENYINSKRKDIKKPNSLVEFRKLVSYLQPSDPSYLESFSKTFHEDSIDLQFSNPFESLKENILIQNTSRKPIVLVMEHDSGIRIVCISSDEERKIAGSIDSFLIYTGYKPGIYYRHHARKLLTNFCFKSFSYLDYKLLNKTFTLNKELIPESNYIFVLSDDSYVLYDASEDFKQIK